LGFFEKFFKLLEMLARFIGRLLCIFGTLGGFVRFFNSILQSIF